MSVQAVVAVSDAAALRTQHGEALRVSVPLGSRFIRPITVVLLALGVVYTVALAVDPAFKTSWHSADARVLIEGFSFSVALFAAVALYIPTGDPVDRSRNAFIAALIALAVSYSAMIIGFIVVEPASNPKGIVGLYAWLVARYLAGGLFIAASLGRPRLSLRAFGAVIAAAMVMTLLLCALLNGVLPSPVARTVDGLAVITFSGVGHMLISGVPAALFGVGAILAWRVHRRQTQPMYGWLAVALAVQSLSKIHDMLYTTTFGPVITSGDLLRLVMLALLLAGAISTVHQVARDRVAALEAQQADIAAVEDVYARLARFADQEQVFRAVVVHELATPIAAVRAFAHVLASPAPQTDLTEARKGIVDASRRLQELVDRMDELRAIEDDDFSVDLRPTPVVPILKEVAGFVQVLPGDHRVVVECEQARAYADPVRLGQALRNLVTNAARYSPAGTPIMISCRRVDGELVRLSVTDSGPGIAEKDRSRMLSKYERGDRSAETPGAGLGLYIADRIVTAHGGRLLLEPAPLGPGTTATIELRGSG